MPEKFPPSGRKPLSTVQWLICTIAAIGFAFDIYELLMLPLIVRPALLELTGAAPGTPEFLTWVGRLFYIPAFAGGIFGLFGGYLTDLLGRRRVLTGSILLYAFSAFAAGFSTSVQMLLVLRCTTFIGVCVEFVAAVAWLAELFSDPKQRESVLGYTQAFSSIGGLLVAAAHGLAIAWAADLPAILLPESLNFFGGTIKDPHAAWRYTLMSGLIPAIPLIVIRPFLPESPAWAEKKAAGTLKRPSLIELFEPRLRRTTLVTTLMFACSYGAAFGAIQQIPQIVPGLPEVKAQASVQIEAEAQGGKLPVPEQKKIEGQVNQKVASDVTKVQEIGGLCGRFLLAFLAVRMISRRALLRIFQIPGLFLMPIVFAWAAVTGLNQLYVGIFLAGLVTVAQFSFWGNYLPLVYPLHLRGTGESFAANIGGRMIGTSFAWVTATLVGILPDSLGPVPHKFAYTSAAVAFFVYLVGSIACFFLPEPRHEELSE
ncbi:MAG: MFS transporter [Planctomycetaceae bacterium]